MDFKPKEWLLWPIEGRCLVHTTAGTVLWVRKGKDVAFPLLPSAAVNGEPVLFLIECPASYLALTPGSQITVERVGNYERFDIQPINFLSALDA